MEFWKLLLKLRSERPNTAKDRGNKPNRAPSEKGQAPNYRHRFAQELLLIRVTLYGLLWSEEQQLFIYLRVVNSSPRH